VGFLHIEHVRDAVFLRNVAAEERDFRESTSSTLNPFIWFRNGMQFINLLPLAILRWLGISKIPELRILSGKTGIKFKPKWEPPVRLDDTPRQAGKRGNRRLHLHEWPAYCKDAVYT
jgi:hypothetical protein